MTANLGCVIVVVDGNEESMYALKWALDNLKLRSSSLDSSEAPGSFIVLHVQSPPSISAGLFPGAIPFGGPRNLKEVDLDPDRFMKDMKSVMKSHGLEDNADDIEEESSSDMDFDDSEDGSDIMKAYEDNEGGVDTFMHSYSDALSKELKSTDLNKSFVRADDQSSKNNEGTSNVVQEMDEEFTPVDVDVNLVKSLLDSFSSQQGQPGPASNLLGLKE